MLVEKANSSLTFAQVADSYFDWYCQRQHTSINVIRNIIYNHLIQFNKIKIDQITAKHIMHYQNKIINNYSADHFKKFILYFLPYSTSQLNFMD